MKKNMVSRIRLSHSNNSVTYDVGPCIRRHDVGGGARLRFLLYY